MNAVTWFSLLWCVGFSAVVFGKATSTESLRSKQHIYSKESSGLSGEKNEILRRPHFIEEKHLISEDSSISQYSTELETTLEKPVIGALQENKSRGSSKLTGLYQLTGTSPIKSHRSPRESFYDLLVKKPSGFKTNNGISTDGETSKDVYQKSELDNLKWHKEAPRNFFSEQFPEVRKIEPTRVYQHLAEVAPVSIQETYNHQPNDKISQYYESPSQTHDLKIQSESPAFIRTESVYTPADKISQYFQTHESAAHPALPTFTHTVSETVHTPHNQVSQYYESPSQVHELAQPALPTFINSETVRIPADQISEYYDSPSKIHEFKHIISDKVHSPPRSHSQNLFQSQYESLPADKIINNADQVLTFRPANQQDSVPSRDFVAELFSEDPTQKLQRSSQFIPICPEVTNITEIYWELCRDFSDDEFFDEMKKKFWTQDVLEVEGLRQNPIKVESLPKSSVTYPVFDAQPVSNDISVNTQSWSKQVPTVIDSRDLGSLNNLVIPLAARTYPPGACIPGHPLCVNYPFQNPEPVPVRKITAQQLSEFESVPSNWNNIVYRKPEVSVALPEVKKPETEYKKHIHRKKGTGKDEDESEEEIVIAVEEFPEFNQIVTTKLVRMVKIEKDGNVFIVPDTGSEDSSEKNPESVEVEVHVSTYNKTRRNTPWNERNAQLNLKDLAKGERWPHLSFLKLIPLSESFEQELDEREKSEEIEQLLKAAQGKVNSDIKPINQSETGN